MSRVVITQTVTPDELDELLLARTTPVHERVSDHDPHRFELVNGPFDSYVRTLTVGEPDADGAVEVESVTDYELAIPIWGWMFDGLVARAIKNPPPPGTKLWWAPPDTMDARAARSLSLLCVYGAFAAYLGTLLSQLNAYFRIEFGASPSEVSFVLIGIRVGAFLAIAVMFFADRMGRKKVLVTSLVISCCVTALGAIAPNLWTLGVVEAVARAFSATVGVLAVIMAAEEMPANSRAFAVSMLTMSGALGAGGVVMFLQLADTTVYAWRVFFVIPLLFIIPALRLAKTLPETRRFEVHEEQMADDSSAAFGGGVSHARRFIILGAGAVLFNIFLAPASNFLNDFLKTEHVYSGGQITLMQLITNLPGGMSIIVGGFLADKYGRKIIGAIGAAAGVGFTVLMYLSTGWGIWAFSLLGTLIGAIAVPALGVYGPELFPTGSRGKFGGGLNLLAVFGSGFGLFAAGLMADKSHFGSYGKPMAILGIGPAILVVVILVFYPETANKELEELNPEDVAPPSTVAGLTALDHDFVEHHEPHAEQHHEHPPRPRRPGT